VIVQIRIEVLLEELLDGFRMPRLDVLVAHMLSDDRSILGFYQPIVIGVPRPRFSLFHQKFVQQLGHRVIDELTPVIRMEA
jgi:hypothetical protein